MKKFDLLVIGGGSAGLACSRRAASYGMKVALFEHKRLGGTCVNVGCVPKKVMYNTAEIASALKMSSAYGFTHSAPTFSFETIKTKRDQYIERLNSIYARKLNETGIEFVNHTASFLSDKIIQANSEQYTADIIVIAGGGEPSHLNIKGADLAIDSDDFFNKINSLPKKCAIIGGGYIAVELCGVLNKLGSETTLIIRRPKILGGFDEMLRDTVMAEMRTDGVQFETETNINSIVKKPDGSLELSRREGGVLTGFDTVIFAVGRHPVTAKNLMGIENTKIKTNSEGVILTDEFDETNVKGIFAIGDINGKILLTPVAIAAGRVLSDRLFGGAKGKKMNYELVPSVVFSHPPCGTIGLTEEQAVQKYGSDNIKTYNSGFTNMFYAVCDRKPKTRYKIVCLLPEERVVGLHLVGIASDEILQGFGVAMKMGATKKDFDSCVAIHPTAAEEIVTMV